MVTGSKAGVFLVCLTVLGSCGRGQVSTDATVEVPAQPEATEIPGQRCMDHTRTRMPLFGDPHLHTSFSFDAATLAQATGAADLLKTREQQSLDHRSRTVESSLKDLASRNEDNLGSIHPAPRPAKRAFDGDRAELNGEDVRSAEALVREDIDSSLHRLRREAVGRQTPDSRKARVDESLDRQQAGPSGQ